MRIATSTLYAQAVANMNQQEATIMRIQQEVSSGKRVLTPADDPVAAATAVRVNLQISRNTDLASNRQTVSASLNTVSTTLSSVTTLMNNIKSELVSAGNGTYDVPQRQFLAKQLQSQMQDLLGFANTQDGNGEYLFSGYQSQTQPFAYGNFVTAKAVASNAGNATLTPATNALASPFPTGAAITITAFSPPTTPGGWPTVSYDVTGLAGGTVSATSTNGQLTAGSATLNLSGTPTVSDSFSLAPAPTQYQGDGGIRSVEVYEGRQMPTNLSGAEVFTQVPTGNGTFVTGPGATNTGTGLISQGNVISAAALTHDNYQLVFNGTGAVTPAPTNQGNGAIDPTSISGTPANQDQFRLSFSSAGGATTYDVLDTSTGATVASAQPYTAGSAISVNGVQFSMSGAPAQGDHFTLAPGPASHYDVLDTTTNTTLLSNQSYAAGNAIQFAGMSFAISGTPNAADTFQVTPSSQDSVFSIMQSAIDALNASGSGAQSNTMLANAMARANAGIDAAQTQISIGQTTVGGRLQELSQLDTSGSELKIQYQQTLTQLTGVDVTAAISDLSQAQVALTAAQKSFVQVQNLSLFNYIQ
jgi:flagellar hook-associated protein 3 FlgL